MNNWTIVPRQRMGPLHLGMEKSKVHAVLGDSYKSRDSKETYRKLGVHCHYDNNDRLIFIETSSTCSVLFADQQLFQVGRDKTLQLLTDAGSEPWRVLDSYIFESLGISISAPYPPDIESVSLFAQGYYDELKKDLENL